MHLCSRAGMDARGLLGLSAIAEEFRDPIDDFRDPIDDFRDPVDDFRDPIDELRDPNQELEDFLVGKQSSSDVDNAKPIVRKARRLLNREVRVGVEDGRVFVGKLHCLDKQQNIILYDTVEFRSFPGEGRVGADGKSAGQRSLGLVLFPVRCRTSCHVKCSLDEKLDFLRVPERSMSGDDEGAVTADIACLMLL